MKQKYVSAAFGVYLLIVFATCFFSLCHVPLASASAPFHGSAPFVEKDKLNQHLSKLLVKQKTRVLDTHVLSLSSKTSRMKRDLGSHQLYRDIEGYSRVQGIHSFGGIGDTIRDAVAFRTKNNDYIAVCTTAVFNNTHVYLLNQDKTLGNMVLHLDIPDAKVLAVSVMRNGDVKLVGAGNTEITGGTTVWNLFFDENTGRAFSSRGETLSTIFPNYVLAWNQYDAGMLAVANSFSVIDNERDFNSEVVIYQNRLAYYDRMDSVRAHNPMKVLQFVIANRNYLFVCNFPNVTSGYKVQSELFEFSLSQGVFLFFQKIPTQGCVDVDYFTIGVGPKLEHYLVVANLLTFKNGGVVYNDIQSVVYKFVQGMFIPFQGIPTYHVNSVLAYKSSKRDLLLIFGSLSGIDLYSYTGFRFVHTGSFGQDILGAGIVRMRSLTGIDPNYFIVASKNLNAISKPNIFLPEFVDEPPLTEYYGETTQWCLAQLEDLDDDTWAEPLLATFNSSVKVNDTEAHLSNAHFANVNVQTAFTDVLRHHGSQLDLSNVFVSRLLDADRQTEAASRDLQTLQNTLAKVVRKEGNYELAGPVIIDKLTASCTRYCDVPVINAVKSAGVDLEELLQAAIPLGMPDISALDLEAIEIYGNLFAPSWSGIDVSKMLTTTSNLSLNGQLRVDGDVTMMEPVYVGGLIDGVKVSTQDLLLKSGDQMLNWDLHTDTLTAKNLQVTSGNFSDINLNFYFDHAITLESDFTLSKPKFAADVDVSHLIFNSLINAVDMSDLYYNALRLYGDQLINGTHRYGIMSVNGNLTVGNYVGGHVFPDDFVLNDGNTHTITGRWSFLDDVQFVDLEVLHKLNTIRVNNGRLDLLEVEKTGQLVTGKKSFGNVTSYGSVFADGYNGVNMAYFVTDEGMYGERGASIVLDTVVADIIKVNSPLEVADLANVDLNRLKNHGVTLDGEVDTDNMILQSVKVNDFQAISINGMPTSSFVTKRDPQVFITAPKTFNNDVIFSEAAHVESTVNGLDLSAIRDTLMLKSGNQHVTGHTIVEGDVLAEGVQADLVSIGDLNLEAFITKDFAGLVTGVKTFDGITVEGNVTVLELAADLVDGVNVTYLANDTLFKTGEQLIQGNNTFLQLAVLEDVAISSFAHFDIDKLLSGIALESQPVVLDDDIAFTSHFVCYAAHVKATIDGVDPESIFHWMLHDVNQTLNTVKVDGSVLVELVEDPSWTIHQGDTPVDLLKLMENAFRVDEGALIPRVAFDTLEVNKMLTPSVNGVPIPSGVVLRKANNTQRVAGLKNFGNLTTMRIEAASEFGGGDPKQFCESQFLKQGSSWTVMGDVVLDNTAMTLVTLNDMNMKQLPDIFWLDDQDIVVTEPQLFSQLSLLSAGLINTVNGMNMAKFEQRRIKLDSGDIQQVTALHSYGDVTAKSAAVNHLFSYNVNNHDIDKLRLAVFTKDTDQEIAVPMVFSNVIANNVTVHGLLNTINLANDVMLKDKSNVVTGTKSFVELQSTGDVKLGPEALVDNVNLLQLHKDAVMQQGTFNVAGQLAFQDATQFTRPLQVSGYVNDHLLSNLMTLSQNQVIETSIVLSSSIPSLVDPEDYKKAMEYPNLAALFSTLQIDGLYHDVDLNRFFTKTVRTDISNNFTSPVYLSGMLVNEVLDNANQSTIKDILESDEQLRVVASEGLSVMERGGLLNEYLSNLNTTLTSQANVLLYFREMLTTSAVQDIKSIVPVFDQSVFAALADQSVEFHIWEAQELVKTALALPLRATLKVESSDKYVASISNSSGYVYEFDTEFFVQRGQVSLSQGSDLTAVRLHGSSCFMFTDRSTASSPILCKSSSATDFKRIAELPTTNIHRVKTVDVDGTLFLGLLHATLPSLTNIITTWKLSPGSNSFVSGPSIFTTGVQDMDIISHGDNILLAVASATHPLAISRGEVGIWRLDEASRQSFRVQRIILPSPVQVQFSAQLGGELVLLVLNGCGADSNIKVYVDKGMGGFQEHSTIYKPKLRGFFVSQDANETTVFASMGDASSGVKLTVLRALFAGGTT